MRKKLFVLSLFISFLLIGISNSQANLYVVEWYGQNGTTSYVPAFYSPNISINDVHFDLGAYGNLTGTTYTTATGLYSPYSSLIATMENDFSGNYGCIYLGGTINKANSGNTIEAKTITTSTGTTTNITTRTKYVYEGSTRNLVFVLNDSVFDNENKIKNLYFAETSRAMNMDIRQSDVNIASIQDFYKFIDDYNNCEGGKSINSTFLTANSFSPKNINYNIHVSTSHATTRTIDIRSYFFVFNSSANGIVNISLFLNQTFIDDGADACALDSFFKIQYAKMENSPAIISLGETNNINSNLLLTTNKIYILEMTFASEIAPTGGGTCSRNISDIINGFVSIDTYIPTWICGNYGECFNGTRSRECNDTNGLTALKIENDVCYTLPEKTLNLGFENKQSFDVFYAQPTWWVFACPFAISSKSVDYPSDWIINNITNPKINNTGSPEIIAYVRDTLKMDNRYSMDGLYSLKMWYIPPEAFLPLCPDKIETENKACVLGVADSSIGFFSQVDKPINETWLVSKNLTFDYPNMTISLYVRKCDDSVQQYAGNSSILANLTGYESCFNGYYTNDKAWTNDIKDTDVYLHIQDLSIGSQVQSVKFNAYKKDWLQYQLRLLNLDTTHLYQFSIGIFPKDYPVDTNVYCAYIDKVELNAYQGAIPCSSFCEGSIYHKAIILNDNACSYEIEYPSLFCCSGSDCNKIENCQSYCGCDKGQSDYLTYHICSNSTGSNVWTSQSNSTYCDGYCKTQNIKEVPEILGDVCLGLESQGLGFLCGFFVPFFILTIIFIIIGAVLAWKTNAWQTFPITIIILFLVASMLWIEFAVIGIIICAVIAFMLAKMWNSGSSGK